MDERASVTASAIINFVEDLERRSAAFYNELARRFPEREDIFLQAAGHSDKIRVQVVRTYRETITDALEACFSFEGMVLERWALDTSLADGITLSEAVGLALQVEEQAVAFYEEVAERSTSLLATITRAFRKASKTRRRRCRDLQALDIER